MRVLRNTLLPLAVCVLVIPGVSQTPGTPQTQAGSATVHRSARSARARTNEVPCWRQAGMTPEMVNQRWKIEDDQKVKISGVCSEPSSSPQQKHDKIEQIHAETDQAIAKLIPETELKTFNQCQVQVDARRPKAAGQKEVGPCGGVIPASSIASPATPSAEHHHSGTPTNQ